MYVTLLGSIVTEFSDLKFDWYVNMFLLSFNLCPFLGYHFQMQGIFIKTISPGSVAESDGRLKVGDQILKVCLTVSVILLLFLLIPLMQQLNQKFLCCH